MRNLTKIILLMFILLSCADNKTINGITYRPYGLLNESACKNDSIEYEASLWAIASGIIFVELVVPPIYTFGYNLYEPIGLKKDLNANIKGIVK